MAPSPRPRIARSVKVLAVLGMWACMIWMGWLLCQEDLTSFSPDDRATLWSVLSDDWPLLVLYAGLAAIGSVAVLLAFRGIEARAGAAYDYTAARGGTNYADGRFGSDFGVTDHEVVYTTGTRLVRLALSDITRIAVTFRPDPYTRGDYRLVFHRKGRLPTVLLGLAPETCRDALHRIRTVAPAIAFTGSGAALLGLD